MILLVTGGRYFGDIEAFGRAMSKLPQPPSLIIQGGAIGADAIANLWGKANGVHVAQVNALWGTYGKAAGHLRNEAMLRLKPDYCLAMPGGRGTDGMKALCRKAGIPVWEPYG